MCLAIASVISILGWFKAYSDFDDMAGVSAGQGVSCSLFSVLADH